MTLLCSLGLRKHQWSPLYKCLLLCYLVYSLIATTQKLCAKWYMEEIWGCEDMFSITLRY